MNLLKIKTSWSNAELWLFKWGVFTAGILAGYYLRDLIKPYLIFIWILSVGACVISVYIWLGKKSKTGL